MATTMDAQGITFSISDGTSPLIIGGITTFSIGGSAPEREKTTLASTNVERKLGLPDFGDLTLGLFYDPSDVGQAEAISAQKANIEREIVVTFSDGSTKTFPATAKPMAITGSVNTDVTADLGLTVAGTLVDA